MLIYYVIIKVSVLYNSFLVRIRPHCQGYKVHISQRAAGDHHRIPHGPYFILPQHAGALCAQASSMRNSRRRFLISLAENCVRSLPTLPAKNRILP